MRVAKFALGALVVALSASNAYAQKSKDTLRLALNDPFVTLSNYHYNVDEASNFNRTLYQSLLAFDEYKKQWVSVLAKSWTRIGDRTLEFDLRDDVKFHNGNPFDADDVVETIKFVGNPASKITFPQRYNWIEKVEKLGPYTVRITSREPLSVDLQLLAYRFQMWDAETMRTHQDVQDYGRLTPVGTGTMKLNFIDKNKGVMLERVENHYADKTYFRAPIKYVHGVPLPDRQTQIAQILTGGIDMIRNASPDDAKELGKNPNLDVSNVRAANIVYIGFDAKGVSNTKVFTDPRVRKAAWMAIDRDAIVEYIVPGGPSVVEKVTAICFQTTTPACNPTVLPPKYDPEGAKKLLAEAGYPNGIDFEYTVFAPQKPIAEAVAGSWLRAGIRATVRPVPLTVYRKDQGDGKFQAWSILFPTGSHPDASNNISTLMQGAFEQYYGDQDIYKLLDAGIKEFDDQKRASIYQQVYDHINSRFYMYPLSSVPYAYVHTHDVKLMNNPLMAGETAITDYAWK